MAILKHIAIKNKSYWSAYKYLTFEHDEFKMIPVLDEFGQMIPRTNMLIDSVNCFGPKTFAAECVMTNKLYNQNSLPKDIKAHHYIISFDPKDMTEKNLTVSMAQAMALSFAKKNFPGHQILVATHSDGHNNSGNIHSHIVLNSVRKLDVDRCEFTERDTDLLAGKKHHVSDKFLAYLKKDLMEMCITNNLNQIDILAPSKVKVSEREYHLCKRQILSGNTSFRSSKDLLREKLHNSLMKSKSFKQYRDNLFNDYGILCYEANEHLIYELPDGKKTIHAKSLGSDYDFDNVTTQVAINNKFTPNKIVHYNTPFVLTNLIDIANNKKAQENIYYKRKLELINLQTKANNAAIISANKDITSMEALENKMTNLLNELIEVSNAYKDISSEIKSLNAQIRFTGQYWANRNIYEQYISLPNNKKEAFYNAHTPEIILYKAAKDYLADKKINNKLPSVKALTLKRDALKQKQLSLYKKRTTLSSEYKEAKILYSNTKTMLDDKRFDSSRKRNKNEPRL